MDALTRILDPEIRLDQRRTLPIRAQVSRPARTPIIQTAWKRGSNFSIHGWIYGLKDGLLRDLDRGYSTPQAAREGETDKDRCHGQ